MLLVGCELVMMPACLTGHRYNGSSQQTADDVTDDDSMDVTHWQSTGSAVSRIIGRLKDMTDKLRNAYRGLDVQWSSAGQYRESVLTRLSLAHTHAPTIMLVSTPTQLIDIPLSVITYYLAFLFLLE